MSSKLRAIQPIARTVWDRAALKTKIDRQVWENAKSVGCVAEPVPVASSRGICPARLHADFNRMLRGDGPAFLETAPALAKLKAELDHLGFVADTRSRYVSSETLNLCGEVDAQGMIDGHMSAVIELKVVRWIPQVVRSADTVQLMLYELARSGRADSSILIGLYIQPSGEFCTAARIVFDPKKLEPLVLEIAA